ncbi:MAG: cytidylate kinase-like family protein [Treponema sp.]|nr:cytidylate kinase-like family protein [Treponema sp.]
MAIITISREVAALGDEVAAALAKKLNYKFITRKDIEKSLVEHGFPENKLPKYDERKPGFLASLAKDRDEYLDLLHLALLEAADQGNVVFIGRGAFALFADVPNHIGIRLIADEKTRVQRLMDEKQWNEKQAKQRINESDTNRFGFHKSFYNVDWSAPQNYTAVLNTSILDCEAAADVILLLSKQLITEESEQKGKIKLDQMLIAQRLINQLVFDHKVKVEFLHAVIEDKTIILQGVSDSIATVELTTRLASEILPEYKIQSAISVIHDFKAY